MKKGIWPILPALVCAALCIPMTMIGYEVVKFVAMVHRATSVPFGP
jgi:hypothetical protein